MKRFYRRSRIMLMTFALGLVVVWFSNSLQSPFDSSEVNESDLINATVVTIVPKNTAESLKFMPTGRGCGGFGYSQAYLTGDGRYMSEGVIRTSLNEFNKELKEAQIIERVETAKNRFGEKGLRVIAKKITREEEYFEILWFGKRRLHYISAPTLDIALEFERLNAYAY